MVAQFRRFYRRLRFGEPIIVVSGLPRSGTSMAMKMLEAAGLPTMVDGIRRADVDNPKGYFELERVKDLSAQEDKSWLGAARGKVVKIISYLLKELPPTYNYKVVFMRRNLEEILASQSKMLEHRDESHDASDAKMTEIFESHLWRANWLLTHSPQFEHLYVHYSDVLSEPRAQAARIAGFLGGGLDVGRMAAVVDERLYRNRAEAGQPELVGGGRGESASG